MPASTPANGKAAATLIGRRNSEFLRGRDDAARRRLGKDARLSVSRVARRLRTRHRHRKSEHAQTQRDGLDH
jgi:hypothetical protein